VATHPERFDVIRSGCVSVRYTPTNVDIADGTGAVLTLDAICGDFRIALDSQDKAATQSALDAASDAGLVGADPSIDDLASECGFTREQR